MTKDEMIDELVQALRFYSECKDHREEPVPYINEDQRSWDRQYIEEDFGKVAEEALCRCGYSPWEDE
ncbi:MAG: hypothetical protein GY861_21540 [bacterium]|nr:hypothetical protein [bacterium]